MYKSIIILLAFMVTSLTVGAQGTNGKPRYHFIENDTIDLYANDTIEVDNSIDRTSGNPSGWTCVYSGDGSVLRNKTDNYFVIVPGDTLIKDTEIHKFSIRLRNVGTDSKVLLDTVKNFVLRIYPRPSAEIVVKMCDSMSDEYGYWARSQVTSNSPVGTFPDAITYATHYLGISMVNVLGDSTLWSWSINDEPQKTRTYMHAYGHDEASDDGMVHEYRIRVVNKLKYRKEPFIGTYLARGIVYSFPKVRLSMLVETYSGRPDGFILTWSGGIKGGWTQQWWDPDDNEVTAEDVSNICYEVTEKTIYEYSMYVENGAPECGSYYGSAVVSFVVWPKPGCTASVSAGDNEITESDDDGFLNIECDEDSNLLFNAYVDGGYENSSNAPWIVVCDGDTAGGNRAGIVKLRLDTHVPAEYDSANYYIRTYDVKVRNQYTGKGATSDYLWYEDSFKVCARIWLKPRYPQEVTIVDRNTGRTLVKGNNGIRRGNIMALSRSEGLNGNGGLENSFVYDWTIYGSRLTHKEREWTTKVYMRDEMMCRSRETMHVQLQVTNLDADGGVIWQQETEEYPVVIYNRPNTPTSLMRKGSGISGTLIAMSDISDADMELYDYYLVFGYETSDGKLVEKPEQVQGGAGSTRFDSRFTSAELMDENNRFFVYAQWCYDDGVTITSGKRYMDCSDEAWDGSDYSGGGGSIGLVRHRDGAASISGIAEDYDARSVVYDLNGRVVSTTDESHEGKGRKSVINGSVRIIK